MMWVLLLTVLNPTMYQLHMQLNPFLLQQKTTGFLQKKIMAYTLSHTAQRSLSTNHPRFQVLPPKIR